MLKIISYVVAITKAKALHRAAKYGHTPDQIAVKEGHSELARMIEAAQ